MPRLLSHCIAMTRPLLTVLCVVAICLVLIDAATTSVIGVVDEDVVSYEGAQLLRVTAPTQELKDEILKLEDVGGKCIRMYYFVSFGH